MIPGREYLLYSIVFSVSAPALNFGPSPGPSLCSCPCPNPRPSRSPSWAAWSTTFVFRIHRKSAEAKTKIRTRARTRARAKTKAETEAENKALQSVAVIGPFISSSPGSWGFRHEDLMDKDCLNALPLQERFRRFFQAG